MSATESLHDVRFPNESAEYRNARNTLLIAERELRRQVERVAAQRRALPLGGEVKEYVFEGDEGPVKLSDLFRDKDELIVYSYMYGPKMESPCPACTSILDALDGEAPHVAVRANLVIVAQSPLARIKAFAAGRGWTHLKFLSASANSYQADYHGEKPDGAQTPSLNVFVRRGGKIHHFWNSELLFTPSDPDQHARHVDMIWPLWNLLDLTPEGRGATTHPKLSYA